MAVGIEVAGDDAEGHAFDDGVHRAVTRATWGRKQVQMPMPKATNTQTTARPSDTGRTKEGLGRWRER